MVGKGDCTRIKGKYNYSQWTNEIKWLSHSKRVGWLYKLIFIKELRWMNIDFKLNHLKCKKCKKSKNIKIENVTRYDWCVGLISLRCICYEINCLIKC